MEKINQGYIRMGLMDYMRIKGIFQRIGVPQKDMVIYENGDKITKLRILRLAYEVARVNKRKSDCIYIKLKYFQLFADLKRKHVLSRQDVQDGYVFLLLGESREGISKYIKDYIYGKKETYFKQSRKTVLYLIGTPHHYNIGDHVISCATEEFLHATLPDLNIVEISMKDFARQLSDLKRKMTLDDIIILQGGGNMGNVYWLNERIRREVIKNFPNNKIFIFPQTIHYEDTVYGRADRDESVKIYSKASKLTICAREKASYEIMKKLYPQCRILLTPDIVCYKKRWATAKERNGALLLFREDGEKSVKSIEGVSELIKARKMTQTFTDMIYQSKGYMGKYNREKIVSDKIKQISSAEIVVTDRLHAMIISAMTGTPCVVFYGYNHKIKSSYETWFKDVPYIKLVEDISKFDMVLDEVMKADIDTDEQKEKLNTGFTNLKRRMWEDIYGEKNISYHTCI